MAVKLKWRVALFDCGARIGVGAVTPDGHRYAVSMPRETFNRREAQAAVREWIADRTSAHG